MTTLSGIVEKVEELQGYLKTAAMWLPGDSPAVQKVRELLAAVDGVLNTSGIRVALGEAESKYSAEAQAIANAWPDEPTGR